MESNSSKPNLTLDELLNRARTEIPPAPDLRFEIRTQIERKPKSALEDWTEILLHWVSEASENEFLYGNRDIDVHLLLGTVATGSHSRTTHADLYDRSTLS